MQTQILPAIRMPRTTENYTYSIPLELHKKIKIGQIVEINLRNKLVQGLVTKIEKEQKKTKYKLKKINKILYPEILITKQQIKLIDFMFDYYLSAKSISLKSILPNIPKKYKKINKYKNKKQKLILVPEIELIDKAISELKLDEKKVIKIHSKISKIKFFKNYLDILNNKEKIIIGTKISVLLPFSNLNEIIIYDKSNWNHKQSDINPRFDARIIAEWLAKKHKCKIKLKNKIKKLKNNNKISIINLKSERLKGNYSFLSEKLIKKIKNNLDKKNKIFIFHNRKGLANYIFCEKCNYVFKCPECGLSMAYHTEDRKLHCHSCNYKNEIDPFCPKCQSSEIKFKGQGIEKIKTELKKEFSNAKIQIFDKQIKGSLPTPLASNGVEMTKINILISTEFAINKLDFSKFNLIAFTNFDQLLYHPDFRTNKRAFNIFHKISSQTAKADIILQTSDMKNFVIQGIAKNKPELFYKTELENCKTFNYPPFIKLIKLSFQDVSEKSVINKTKKSALQIKENFKNIEVLGPLENHPKKIRNKFKYNIILKTALNFQIKKLLKLIPNDFVVDVDPEKI